MLSLWIGEYGILYPTQSSHLEGLRSQIPEPAKPNKVHQTELRAYQAVKIASCRVMIHGTSFSKIMDTT